MNRDRRIELAREYQLKFAEEFEDTLDNLAAVRHQKCREYGESRYEETDPEFNAWALFMDVWRKFIRLRSQLKNKDHFGMLETYQDLALYAIMAVQILSRPQEKRK